MPNSSTENNLNNSSNVPNKGYLITKRIFDIFGSSLGIILSLIPGIITAIAIKKEDPDGPVLYESIRIGKDGKPFKMYKFRSMYKNADKRKKELLEQNEVEGAMFKMHNDPRVTKVGHVIRKYSIDELPQFINVFKGDMSLVGPRPPLPDEVAKYDDHDRLRLAVEPGCTGLWQVSGRSALSFKQMVELDLKYIKNRSILLDLDIMFRTVKIMIVPNTTS